VADLWFVDTVRPLGRSVPTWRSDLRDRVDMLMGHAGSVRASIRFWTLVPIWRGTGRKGEEVSICQLVTCSGVLMTSPCSGMVIRAVHFPN
jgi:hypothetical protein